MARSFSRFTQRRQNFIIHDLIGPYRRFKSNINVNFVYYYAKTKYAFVPPDQEGKPLKKRAKEHARNNDMSLSQFLTLEQVMKKYNVKSENKGCFFLLKYNGKQVVVRVFRDRRFWPSEDEWAAGFKRLIQQSPKIVFLTGHGERSPFKQRRISYKMLTSKKKFRYSLLNQGYTIDTLSLQAPGPIPTDIAGLVIADPREPYSQEGLAQIKAYIAAGGNLFIAGGMAHRKNINPVFNMVGLSLRKGWMAQSNRRFYPANMISAYLTKTARHLTPQLHRMFQNKKKYRGDSTFIVRMRTAAAISYPADPKGFTVKQLLKTREDSTWLRQSRIPRDSLHIQLPLPPGAPADPFTTAVMMTRHKNGKKQIVFASSDADYLAANTIRYGNNFPFGFYSLSKFSYGEFPANTLRHDTDQEVAAIVSEDLTGQKIIYKFIIPFLIIVGASILIIRRRRK